jgi:hypothetical protein
MQWLFGAFDIERNQFGCSYKRSEREQSDSRGEVYAANRDGSDVADRGRRLPLFNMCANL